MSQIDDISLESVYVENSNYDDSDTDFSSESYCVKSFKSETPENELHQLLNQFSGADEVGQNVKQLRKTLLISPSSEIDALDNGGSCVLYKVLKYFLDIKYKDDARVDVVELVLNKSYLDYRNYQEGIVLTLLQIYDKSISPFVSIKFLQWQILNREGEALIVRWQMIQQDSDKGEDNNNKDVKKFVRKVHKAIHNKVHLDDMIESTLASGSLELLKYLKRFIDENGIALVTPIIINAVSWRLFVKRGNMEHFQKCFEYLLDVADKKELSLGDKNGKGMTALHFADHLNDDYMVKKLLLKGAPITAQDVDMKFPVQNVKFDTLKEFFDSLVTATPSRFLADESVWQVINSIYKNEYGLDGFIFMDFNTFEWPQPDGNRSKFENLQLIKFISESPRLCRLIDHPISATLLEMHWSRFKKWSLLDQISVIYMLFALIVFFVKFGLLSFISIEFSETVDFAIAGLTAIFLLTEIIKNYKICQVAKMCFLRIFRQNSYKIRNFPIYQTTTSIFLKIPVLVLLIIFAMYHCDQNLKNCKETIGIGSILMSINFTLLIAYFSQTVAHCVIIFLYVAYTGFKFILCMILILFGFGIGLVMLINNFTYAVTIDRSPYESPFNTANNADENTGNAYDWGKIWLSLFRTFVMSTGELEVSNFQFHTISSYIVFSFFVFVIPIVFFNLLNGLAIEDISVIKKEGMYWYRKTQLKVLNECERLYWKV